MGKVTLNDLMNKAYEVLNNMSISEFLSEEEKERILLLFKYKLLFYLKNFKHLGFLEGQEGCEFFKKAINDEKKKEMYEIHRYLFKKLEEEYMIKLFDEIFEL